MSMIYIISIVIVLKLFRIFNGKSKQIKFPNLWLFPILFLLMIIEDYAKGLSFSVNEFLVVIILIIIGLCVGIIRGRTLKYHKDEISGEVYYKESYLSLGVYIFLIFIKWFLKYVGGDAIKFIGTGLIVFGCASMIGRSLWLSYKYLQISRESR
ncbi:DUF1453 domain-containing protein [Clostridium sp. BL-8]|uniref:DUF1453 domain-containing protein n=1 Tax=Clostridium sp. BL-8 TaxID=349938 RepID=UPI0009CFDBEE|nr:DUF1453 domain-containing protein [Clostridium sp. BL-8]OOM78466.1 hypothetical protein CLOBL_23140 [Clostridium sp. BL-8]